MTIPYSRFKPKQSLSQRSNVVNSSNNSFKLSTLLLRKTNQREMMVVTQWKITRITLGRLNARTISSWPHRKTETMMEERQTPISKSNMVMNKKMKE